MTGAQVIPVLEYATPRPRGERWRRSCRAVAVVMRALPRSVWGIGLMALAVLAGPWLLEQLWQASLNIVILPEPAHMVVLLAASTLFLAGPLSRLRWWEFPLAGGVLAVAVTVSLWLPPMSGAIVGWRVMGAALPILIAAAIFEWWLSGQRALVKLGLVALAAGAAASVGATIALPAVLQIPDPFTWSLSTELRPHAWPASAIIAASAAFWLLMTASDRLVGPSPLRSQRGLALVCAVPALAVLLFGTLKLHHYHSQELLPRAIASLGDGDYSAPGPYSRIAAVHIVASSHEHRDLLYPLGARRRGPWPWCGTGLLPDRDWRNEAVRILINEEPERAIPFFVQQVKSDFHVYTAVEIAGCLPKEVLPEIAPELLRAGAIHAWAADRAVVGLLASTGLPHAYELDLMLRETGEPDFYTWLQLGVVPPAEPSDWYVSAKLNSPLTPQQARECDAVITAVRRVRAATSGVNPTMLEEARIDPEWACVEGTETFVRAAEELVEAVEAAKRRLASAAG